MVVPAACMRLMHALLVLVIKLWRLPPDLHAWAYVGDAVCQKYPMLLPNASCHGAGDKVGSSSCLSGCF